MIDNIDEEAKEGTLIIDEGPLEDPEKMYRWAAAEHAAFAELGEDAPED